MLSTARPSPLRLAGFAATIAGALLMGVGALLTWATVGFRARAGQPRDAGLDSVIVGTDTWQGIAMLAAAVLVLVLVMATRLVGEPRTTRWLALSALAIAIGATLLAAVTLARVQTEYRDPGVEALARDVAEQIGLPVDAVTRQLERRRAELVEIRTGPGMPVAIAGGLLAALGTALVVAWTRRRRLVAGVERDLERGTEREPERGAVERDLEPGVERDLEPGA
jgi:hypothetical protein